MDVNPTRYRVEENTDPAINREIARRVEENVLIFSRRLDDIETRLRELDSEWDIERTLEANAAAIMLVSLLLGTKNKAWHLLSGVVAAFLLQHAVQGWCPPVPIFRRLGIRTMNEIDRERYALKAVRGDFRGLDPEEPAEQSDKAVRATLAAE
jgi:hypothetical protein